MPHQRYNYRWYATAQAATLATDCFADIICHDGDDRRNSGDRAKMRGPLVAKLTSSSDGERPFGSEGVADDGYMRLIASASGVSFTHLRS